jgi:hypothetical protein
LGLQEEFFAKVRAKAKTLSDNVASLKRKLPAAQQKAASAHTQKQLHKAAHDRCVDKV